jgi:hypothetical protein
MVSVGLIPRIFEAYAAITVSTSCGNCTKTRAETVPARLAPTAVNAISIFAGTCSVCSVRSAGISFVRGFAPGRVGQKNEVVHGNQPRIAPQLFKPVARLDFDNISHAVRACSPIQFASAQERLLPQTQLYANPLREGVAINDRISDGDQVSCFRESDAAVLEFIEFKVHVAKRRSAAPLPFSALRPKIARGHQLLDVGANRVWR